MFLWDCFIQGKLTHFLKCLVRFSIELNANCNKEIEHQVQSRFNPNL